MHSNPALKNVVSGGRRRLLTTSLVAALCGTQWRKREQKFDQRKRRDKKKAFRAENAESKRVPGK